MSSFTLKLHSQQGSVSLAAAGSLQASSKTVGSRSDQLCEALSRYQLGLEAG